MRKSGKNTWTTVLALVVVIALAVIPLLMHRDSEFGGADGKAEEVITEISGDYEPWASPIWEPPGGETESLLFALQAAIGAGVIGYGLGFLRGKSKGKEVSKS